MADNDTIFDQNYQYYLEQLREVPFDAIAPKIGAEIDENNLIIECYGPKYQVSNESILDPNGTKAAYDLCVILSKYILLCPETAPQDHDWVAFRNLKDSGPLIGYFTNTVEAALGTSFTGRLDELKSASDSLGGYASKIDAQYDLTIQFDALPRIPVLLLFNDGDEEFPSACSILFESRVEAYLDAECIAMLGGQLVRHLRKALR